ncbi:MAG: 4Fe-4S dicluster domain-containing protein, partial [Betaproteobacteria bacterium]
DSWRRSWVYDDLYKVRNVKPGLKWGMWAGTLHGGLHMWLNDLGLGKLVGWTLHHHQPDHATLKAADDTPRIAYPKYDGVVTFDKLSSVFLSNTNHEEDQPVHLQLGDPTVPVDINLRLYDGPEASYCPAGVYEFVDVAPHTHVPEVGGNVVENETDGDDIDNGNGNGNGNNGDRAGDDLATLLPTRRLQINAQNCVHCKTCDIKDPRQNIHWVPPEGGGGPNYPNM